MNRLQGEIAEWAVKDCSEERYLEIYGKMLELTIPNFWNSLKNTMSKNYHNFIQTWALILK